MEQSVLFSLDRSEIKVHVLETHLHKMFGVFFKQA